MRAAFIEETGTPDVIQFGDLPTPQPGPGQVLVRVRAVGRGQVGQVAGRRRPAGGRPPLVDGLAVGDRHEPRPHVAVGAQPGVGGERRQERLGPGVLGVGCGQDRPAHAHHDVTVHAHELVERDHGAMMPTHVTARSPAP